MSVVKGLLATALAFGFISLMGCSDDGDTASDTTAPVISNVSHTDNEKVIGSRTITFSADVADESSLTVTVTHNGNPVSATSSGSTYSASITLADRTNNTVVINADDGTNTTSQSVTLNYPFLAFTNGQAASVVIGQLNFNSFGANQGGAVDSNTLDSPYDVKIINDRLYIADRNNNRVLGFNSIPTSNNANADFVIGQDSLTTNAGGFANNQLDRPRNIEFGGGDFFTSHDSPGRVHTWSSIPTSNINAEIVFGQSGFVNGTSACTQDKTGGTIAGVEYADGKILVTDRTNNRVLVWNSVPTTNGQAADLVIGQSTFELCAHNDKDQNNVTDPDLEPNASTLYRPQTVWSDGNRVIIVDESNTRVLIWNSFPTVNFQAADIVLGQSNFVSNIVPINTPTPITLKPYAAFSNGNQIFVTDRFGDRVMIWDSWPTENNQPADRVLGAIDFYNDKTGLGGNELLRGPRLMDTQDNKLVISDPQYDRILVFEAP